MLHAFSRTEMLIGTENLNKLKKSRVAVFGIGGVGTFVVEGLIRSAVGSFVLVDNDDICVTNINRQIHATTKTIGKSKVEVMKQRILEINPEAQVEIFHELYNKDSAEKILSKQYSYVVDAIDTVSAKLDLVERCYKMGIPIISSMGAGNKLNPTMLEVADIYETSVCPLARVIRTELRKRKIPKLKVVYSKEKPLIPLKIDEKHNINCTCFNKDKNCMDKRQIPGSVSFVPSVAGLIIASEVVKDLIKK
ncbi:tRNA threonylcarbamoyladenosine dehydratase [Garciella nitratireducens]|uniref:tRNA A37 threonylcarbamoyladenosine dehydratase n=1 Tax=Garciella nitratireducens DSM 15102 TaxID=1121911 RepID=A0A1T4KMQ9_9FIRM|nr:tRNA threonylcarbamoyladenosine dehydratase [Garciella nitratireducens]SJZ43684.1 tRNA A37 threonylcarbamoyladenosine dehydratase [Garciella nitratireducens DSM 15102]